MSTPASPRYMAEGIVSVFPETAPATVMVAPNSPTALAQARMKEAMMPLLARGKLILRKVCQRLQPRK